jgi:hypothetical protein
MGGLIEINVARKYELSWSDWDRIQEDFCVKIVKKRVA